MKGWGTGSSRRRDEQFPRPNPNPIRTWGGRALIMWIIEAVRRLTVAPSAARRGVTILFSRRASHVCSSSTAIQHVKGIIGRSTKNYVSNVLPSYVTRLFKDPPSKEDCPICFLPMPLKIITCVSLPPATLVSVPIYDFAEVNEELVDEHIEVFYPCCGMSVCYGCIYSFVMSGNNYKCPFCKAERSGKTNNRIGWR